MNVFSCGINKLYIQKLIQINQIHDKNMINIYQKYTDKV